MTSDLKHRLYFFTFAITLRMLLLTPEGPWTPHESVYAKNEEHMLDWEGNMVEKQTCQKFMLEEVEDNIEMSIGSVIAEAESSAIDKVYEHISSCFGESTQQPHKSKTTDICDVNCLARMLEEKAMIGNYMCSIGAICGTSKSYMCDLDDDVPRSNANIIDLDMSLDEIDLDEFMVISADIKSYKEVNAEKLSQI